MKHLQILIISVLFVTVVKGQITSSDNTPSKIPPRNTDTNIKPSKLNKYGIGLDSVFADAALNGIKRTPNARNASPSYDYKKHLQMALQPIVDDATAYGVPPGQYRIIVEFTVCKDGSICNLSLAQASNIDMLDKGALQTIQHYKGWTPARNEQNEPVLSRQMTPIVFFIDDEYKLPDAPRIVYQNATIVFDTNTNPYISTLGKDTVTLDVYDNAHPIVANNKLIIVMFTVSKNGIAENIIIKDTDLDIRLKKAITYKLLNSTFIYNSKNKKANNKIANITINTFSSGITYYFE